MKLAPGTDLAHYRLLEKIGEGGMGVVWKAEDTKLGRQVAVKILPEDVATDTQRLARFEREAKLLAALNHPNVAAIYGFEEAGGRHFLVLELVNGQTLSQMTKAGPLPVEESLEICRQVADGLEAAHEAGVMHRDLKPGNIIVTDEGKAKVLDFGLAKGLDAAAGGEDSGSDLSMSPTVTVGGTQAGVVMGTAPYMSPEQARGKRLDKRTDIFSFGCVLYECLTGKLAFPGETVTDTLSAILQNDPDWSALPGRTPPRVRELLERCLEKSPRSRLHHIGDARIDLEKTISGREWTTSGFQAVDTGMLPGAAGRPVVSRLMPFLLLAAGLVAGLLLAPLFGTGNPVLPPAESLRLSLSVPNELRILPEPAEIAVSPDGKSAVFSATDSNGNSSLWLRALSSRQPRQIPDTEGARLPFWSPDGRDVGFFAGGSLKRVPVSGRHSAQVLADATDGRGGSWSEGGVIIFAPYSSGPIFSVSAGGGSATQVTELDEGSGELAQRFPQFLPDGRHFIYVSLAEDRALVETRLASLDGGSLTTLLSADGAAVFAGPDHLIFQRGNTLHAQRFDPERRELSGESIALVDEPGGNRGYAGATPVSASAAGVLVYPEGNPTTDLIWFDRGGHSLETLALPPDNYTDPSLSPDGRQVALVRPSEKNDSDIWIVDLDRTVPTRATFLPFENQSPAWSADGRRLAFGSMRDGSRNIYVKDQGGTAPDQVLIKMKGLFANPMAWSPDGKALLVRDLRPETRNDVDVFWLEEERLEPLLDSRFEERGPAISPDGKWLAYRSDESGQQEVYVQPFPGLGAKHQISTDGTGSLDPDSLVPPLWKPDGSELVLLNRDDLTLMAVPIRYEPSFRAGRPEPLFKMPPGTLYYTSIDNERFLLVIERGGAWNLAVAMNWTADLEHAED